MKRFGIGFVLLLGVMTSPVRAQSTVFSEDFESGTAPGWTLDPAVGGCQWAVDGTPATSFALLSCGGLGDPTPKSGVPEGVFALNWNDGTDMDYGGTLTAGNSATSPVISMTTFAGVTLTFDDYYEMDSCAKPNNHKRWVEILDGVSSAVLKSVQLTYSDGTTSEESCPPLPLVPGTVGNLNDHHIHTIDLSTISAASIQVRFRFESTGYTGAGFEDTLIGWFVDEVEINCPIPDTFAPSTPTLVFPASGACTTSPITFDWNDAVDAGGCGPGVVDGYNWEVDFTGGGFAPPLASFFTPTSSIIVGFGVAGTFDWRVQAVDADGNLGAFSTVFTFTVEFPLPPLAPDTLFVNERVNGAQVGDPGFVDPVTDVSPVFSAIFRDPNCGDSALTYRLQVSTDPTFTLLDFDSGTLPLALPVPKDARTPDLPIGVSLLKDTVYFWRIQMSDSSGPSPFSASQSFRIGDDFEFGVREGSSHHGRRCWIATAALGSPSAPTIERLQAFRQETLSSTGAGSAFSRGYHTFGAGFAGSVPGLKVAAPLIGVLGAACGSGSSFITLMIFVLAVAGLTRVVRK